MTKKEREVVQKFINQFNVIDKEEDEVFAKLQELNRSEGTGKAWCSAESNYKDLLSCGKDYSGLYERYIKAGAQRDLINKFGQELADIGFWKEKEKCLL